MTHEEILNLLREKLTIKMVRINRSFSNEYYIGVELRLDDEVISSSEVEIDLP